MKFFTHMLLFILAAGMAMGSAIIGCEDGSKSDSDSLMESLALLLAFSPYTVYVDYGSGNFPGTIDHAHYTAYDGDGNKVYRSPERPMGSNHRLPGIPGSTRTIVLEYHTDGEEKMHEETHPVDFSAGNTVTIMPQYHAPALDPARLAIVDDIGGNLIVRGNFPMVSGSSDPCYRNQTHCFAYSELDARMKELVPGFNLDDYEIIDFSLIDNRSTKDELTAEMNSLNLDITDVTCGDKWPPFDGGCSWDPKTIYYSATSDKKPYGVVWWPMWACPNKPCNNSGDLTTLNNFRFLEVSAYLKELLTTPAPAPGKKRLVYFHCVQGTDRTGALHINYIMDNNPGMTFAEAIRRATIGAKQGSEDQQLAAPLIPLCTYVGQAYRYCLEKNKTNAGICDMPGGFGNDATRCRN